ncbi:acyl carrier protein [Nonomuraea sp. B12E4]|uniref:acyl carrier protein n=1 Tax=Nonomuraea sp. B12E4 TaxID=3153564 RepID=UPI00325D254F
MNHTDTIKQFLIKEFLPDITPDELDADHDLLTGGVIDSLGLLKLIAWIEGEFGVAVGDTDLDPDNFRTVAAIAAFADSAQRQRLAGI